MGRNWNVFFCFVYVLLMIEFRWYLGCCVTGTVVLQVLNVLYVNWLWLCNVVACW